VNMQAQKQQKTAGKKSKPKPTKKGKKDLNIGFEHPKIQIPDFKIDTREALLYRDDYLIKTPLEDDAPHSFLVSGAIKLSVKVSIDN